MKFLRIGLFVIFALGCSQSSAWAQAPSEQNSAETNVLAPETIAILQPKLRAWVETLEERARKVMGQQLADGRFLLYVRTDISPSKFSAFISDKQKNSQLTTLPIELGVAEKQKIVAESLTSEQITLITDAVIVTLTFDKDVPNAQASALQEAITNALGLNKKRGDSVVVKKASLSASFSEVTKNVEKLRFDVSRAEAERVKLQTELRAAQDKAAAAEERVKDEREKIKRLEEDLSIYKTPLGDIKKLIKGLELPLTILPIAFLLFIFAAVGFFVYLRFQGVKTNKLMQAADVMAQAFAKANRAGSGGGLTLDAARTELTKLTANQNQDAAKTLPGALPQALLGEELASAKQKAMDAWTDLKKYPYLTYAELREWLVGGGAQTQRFIALGNALGPVESMRLLQQFSPDDLSHLRTDTMENASELPGYVALLQLHRKVMAEAIRRPQCVSTLDFPELVRANDDSLTAALSENSAIGIALCINLLPDTRLNKILDALPQEKKSACVEGMAKLDELADSELAAEISNLQKTLTPLLASSSSPRIGAAEKMAQILRESSPKTRAALQESLGKHDKLRSKVTEKMVTFEDVIATDDDTLTELIDEFEPEQIASLMSGLAKQSQDRLEKVLSRKVVVAVQSELQRLNARSSTLRRAQSQSIELQAYLTGKLKSLVDEGVIELSRNEKSGQQAFESEQVPALQESSENITEETA